MYLRTEWNRASEHLHLLFSGRSLSITLYFHPSAECANHTLYSQYTLLPAAVGANGTQQRGMEDAHLLILLADTCKLDQPTFLIILLFALPIGNNIPNNGSCMNVHLVEDTIFKLDLNACEAIKWTFCGKCRWKKDQFTLFMCARWMMMMIFSFSASHCSLTSTISHHSAALFFLPLFPPRKMQMCSQSNIQSFTYITHMQEVLYVCHFCQR